MAIKSMFEIFSDIDEALIGGDACQATVGKIYLRLVGGTLHEMDGSKMMYTAMSRKRAEYLAMRILEVCAACRIAERQLGPKKGPEK